MALIKPPPGTPIDWSDPLSRGLLGCWPLSVGVGKVLDATGQDAPAGLTTGVSWTPGPYGPALSFTGTTTAAQNVVDLGNVARYRPAGGLSVAVRFRADSTVTGTWQTLLSRGTVFSGGWDYILSYNSTDLRFYTGGSSNFATIAAPKNAWRTAVATWDGANNRIYLDGTTGTPAAQATAPSGSFNLTLGRGSAAGAFNLSDSFGGLIDCAALWGRALSAAEARALAADPLPFLQVPRFSRYFLPPAGGAASGTGSAAGDATASGVGAALAAGAGSAPGSATAAGVGSSLAAATASASGLATASSTGASLSQATASTTGLAAAAGAGASLVLVTASAAGTSTAIGVPGGAASGAGSADGTATAAATGVAVFRVTASAAGLATAAGVGSWGAKATAAGTATTAGAGLWTVLARAAGTSTATGRGVSGAAQGRSGAATTGLGFRTTASAVLAPTLGRFRLGDVVPLTLATVDGAGAAVIPDAAPVATLTGPTLATTVLTLALDPGVSDHAHFALPFRIPIGSAWGRYTVTYTYSWAEGGGTGTAHAVFDAIAGGDPGGAVVSMAYIDRPEARYVVAQLASGRLVQGRNPHL